MTVSRSGFYNRSVLLTLAHLKTFLLSLFGGLLLFSDAAAVSVETNGISSELHWVVTEEKFELAVERLRSNRKAQTRFPVVLSHGFFMNSSFLNLGEKHSLARYLALQGLDVWNLSFRGTGRSLAPLKNPPKTWNLDVLIEQDIPQVIRYVLRETKSPRVAWVGYELGGILLYSYLGKRMEPTVAALVTIAAPLTFEEPEQSSMKGLLTLEDSPTLKKAFLYLNGPFLMRHVVPFVPKVQSSFYDPANIDEEVKEQFLARALTSINPGVLDHLLFMLRRGEALSWRDDFRYRRHLGQIQIPVLLIGGERDPLAPPKSIRDVYTRLGSTDRTIKIFGPASKGSMVYRHLDLVLGRNAPEEVFPVIGQWLKQKSGRH